MYITLFIILSIALWTDLKSRKIYNWLILAGLSIGLICQIYSFHFQGFPVWFLGVLTGFFCSLPLYLIRGMAAGDVKLLSAVGGFLGYEQAFMSVLMTFIAGGILALFYVVTSKCFNQLKNNLMEMALPIWLKANGVNMPLTEIGDKSVGRIPYALAIMVGTLFTIFFIK